MKVAGSNPAIGILYFMQKYPKGYSVAVSQDTLTVSSLVQV